jgi:hypothetical protein
MSNRWNCNPNYQRGWYRREYDRIGLHPAVIQALDVAHPKDLHQLVLEHPHISTEGKLAYTQNDEKGFKDIQTVTTVGRYLTRHFPNLPDHEVRGLAQLKMGCRIVSTMEEMQHALMNGPHSCMKWKTTDNPYQSYCPSLGWALAINEVCDDIVGRALVHKPTKTFVRTYAKASNGSTTSCNTLQHWLGQQGFAHANDWEDGTKLKRIKDRAPYLDGDKHKADMEGDFWVTNTDGEYTLSGQNGDYESAEDDNIGCCHSCGRILYDGDDYDYVNDDEVVCQNCLDENYVYVTGAHGNDYYVHGNDAIYINDMWYHSDYLDEQNELRRLYDGEYAHEDDCFYCVVAEEYYLNDEENEVELANGERAAECNAWQCAVSGDWYGNNEGCDAAYFMKTGGETVHPDNVEPDDPEDFELVASPIKSAIPKPEVEIPMPSEAELYAYHNQMAKLLNDIQPERIYEPSEDNTRDSTKLEEAAFGETGAYPNQLLTTVAA